jgi:hypothetical protein
MRTLLGLPEIRLAFGAEVDPKKKGNHNLKKETVALEGIEPQYVA